MSRAEWSPPRIACRFFESDPDWEKIAPSFLRETVSGDEPQQATWCKVAWTRDELRILFRAEDNFAWATHTTRDAPLYEEEVVELFLDPIGDFESYFEFEVNPLNTVCDLVLRRTRSGYRKSFSWNCEGLRSTATVHPEFWQVEMAIPFAGLGSIFPRVGDAWRVNFCRIDRPKNAPRELSAWSPTGRANFHVQPRFGWLDFVL